MWKIPKAPASLCSVSIFRNQQSLSEIRESLWRYSNIPFLQRGKPETGCDQRVFEPLPFLDLRDLESAIATPSAQRSGAYGSKGGKGPRVIPP
jgi:hypothetical protein